MLTGSTSHPSQPVFSNRSLKVPHGTVATSIPERLAGSWHLSSFAVTDGPILPTVPFPFWDPTFSHFANRPFSISESFILSLNYTFGCFRFSPLFFLFPLLGWFCPHHGFPFCLLNYLHLHFSPSWNQTHLPTLVSWLIHTGTERLKSRKHVILGISLAVQRLRQLSQCRGPRFDSWSGN